MWSYYKKTFAMVQTAAFAVSVFVYGSTDGAVLPASVFFVTMQVSALFGAMWANRLRRRVLAADRA